MKHFQKTLLLLFIGIAYIPMSVNGQGLRTLDLEIGYLSPENGKTYEHYDTVDISIYIINHGPDTLFSTDTFTYNVFNVAAEEYPTKNIAPNDTFIFSIGNVYAIDTTTESGTFKAFLHSGDSSQNSYASTLYTQVNTTNDTARVTFSIKGIPTEDTTSGIANNRHPNIKTYPNPVNDFVQIDGLNGHENIAIIDATGRKIKTIVAKNGSNNIRLEKLSSGIYTILIESKNKVIHQEKILKK